jgi:hypothetical protein
MRTATISYLREKFASEVAATALLETAGYTRTTDRRWVTPYQRPMEVEEVDALDYLALEGNSGEVRNAKVGDVLRWGCVPSGALISESAHNVVTLRVGDCGLSVGSVAATARFETYDSKAAWLWSGCGGQCRILALGLTGDETAEELKAAAAAGLAVTT